MHHFNIANKYLSVRLRTYCGNFFYAYMEQSKKLNYQQKIELS